jgi:uncharacterized membrane protein
MAVAATLYDWLKLLHILAAMIWLGGGVAVGTFAAQALRSREGDSVARFVGNLRVVGPVLFLPALLAVLGLGIWLVLDSNAWEFGQTWVWLALTLFAAAFVLGAIFQSRAALSAERAVAAGDHVEAARQLRRWALGMGLIIVLLVVITWDMVIKPGL